MRTSLDKVKPKDIIQAGAHLFANFGRTERGFRFRRCARFGLSGGIILDEEQSYNSCNGILHMCTGQSKLLAEETARLCVEGNACRYVLLD